MSNKLLTKICYGYYKKNNKFYFKSSSQVHIIMGGGQSRAQMIKRFNKINPHKWNTVRKEGLTEIAVDQDGREGQVNVVNYDPRNKLEEELEVYFFRRHFNAPIVKCYGAEPINNDSIGFCGVQNTLKVITERIVKRWSQLPQLTFPQSIYSLRQALLGYKTLFKEVGAFEVNHNMLGLNKSGDLHVWLNENFAENKPRLQKGILYTTESLDTLQKVDTEPEMVSNIINLIAQKCQEGKFPNDFRDLIGNSSQGFQNCLDQIEAYIDARKILIPSKIHLDNDKMYLKSIKRVQQPLKILSGSGFKITEQKKWQPSPNKLNFDYIVPSPKRQASPLTTPKHISLISPGLSGSRQLKKNLPSPSSNIKQTQVTSPIKYISPVGYLSTTGPAATTTITTTNNYTLNTKNQLNGQGYKKNITFGSSDQIGINARYNDLKTNPNINAAQSVYDRSPNASFLLTEKIGDVKIDGPSTNIISGSGPGNTGFTTYTGTQGVNSKLQNYKDTTTTILQGSGSKPNTNIKFNYQPSSLAQPGKQISSNTFTSNTYSYLPKTTDYQIQGTTKTTTDLGTKSYTTTTQGYTTQGYTAGDYTTGGSTGPGYTTAGYTTFAPLTSYSGQDTDKKLQIQTSQVTKQY